MSLTKLTLGPRFSWPSSVWQTQRKQSKQRLEEKQTKTRRSRIVKSPARTLDLGGDCLDWQSTEVATLPRGSELAIDCTLLLPVLSWLRTRSTFDLIWRAEKNMPLKHIWILMSFTNVGMTAEHSVDGHTFDMRIPFLFIGIAWREFAFGIKIDQELSMCSESTPCTVIDGPIEVCSYSREM